MTKFYAVAVGKKRGIYLTWEECREQVLNHKGSVLKKFNTRQEAAKFLEEHHEKLSRQNNENNKQKKNGEKHQNENKEPEEKSELEEEKESGKENKNETEKKHNTRRQKNEKDEEEAGKNLERKNSKTEKAEDEKQQGRENGKDNCGKCGKEVKAELAAIMCEECDTWYHAHSKCGKELEVVHEWLTMVEQAKFVPMNWICLKCEESENLKKMEREDEIVRLKNEVRQMREETKALRKVEDDYLKIREELKKSKEETTQYQRECENTKKNNNRLENEVKESKERLERGIKEVANEEMEKTKEENDQLKVELETYKKKLKDEEKKHNRELEKMKKEVARYTSMIEQIRMEKSNDERKIVQLEENIKDIMAANKELEIEEEANKRKENPSRKEREKEDDGKQEERRKDAGTRSKKCYYFERYGDCKRGDECWFEHDQEKAKKNRAHKRDDGQRRERQPGEVPVKCKWGGNCRYGFGTCWFQHEKVKQSSAAKTLNEEKGLEEKILDQVKILVSELIRKENFCQQDQNFFKDQE